MRLEVIHEQQQAVRVARRALEVDSCSPSDTRFEILRATVWSMTAPGGKAHVNRVLGAALPSWSLLSERANASGEVLRAELREALSMLEDAGDLVELSGGHWASATARFVELPDRAGYLLVGGVPTAMLRVDLGAVQFHGPHRHIAKPPLKLATAIPVESLSDWARLPRNSLHVWARQVVSSLELQPYSPTTAEAFEFYLPANSRPGTPQHFRWFESAGDWTGTLLARRRRLYGAREYRLVDTNLGRIVSACELHDVDVRRLMYALDLAAENPVLARPVRVGTQIEWLLTSELPRAEQRTFAALGELKASGGHRFERRWLFIRNEELALEMLSSLGIELGQVRNEESR